MLHQFQCDREGTLFYYQHGNAEAARSLVCRCPICGSKRVKATGRQFPEVDERSTEDRVNSGIQKIASALRGMAKRRR